MTKRIVLAFVVVATALLASGAQTYSACGNPINRTAGAVMCCCQTFGGSCCREVEGVCPGVFIPGCQCSGLVTAH
jgi:hypothetical protein